MENSAAVEAVGNVKHAVRMAILNNTPMAVYGVGDKFIRTVVGDDPNAAEGVEVGEHVYRVQVSTYMKPRQRAVECGNADHGYDGDDAVVTMYVYTGSKMVFINGGCGGTDSNTTRVENVLKTKMMLGDNWKVVLE